MVWQLENMGLGNMALIKKRCGEHRRPSPAVPVPGHDSSEITAAQANLQSAAARVVQAERSLRRASPLSIELRGSGTDQAFEDVLEQIYRPQEVVYALKLLKVPLTSISARWPTTTSLSSSCSTPWAIPAGNRLSSARPDQLPVDTTRPDYLPAVGTGPPGVNR